jgi:Stage II sporulation protein E (SpoIIE)/CHASE domain
MAGGTKRQDVMAFINRGKWALVRIAVGLLVTFYVFAAVGRSGLERIRLGFEKQAASEAVAIVRGVETTMAVLDSLQRLYNVRAGVTRREFRDFVTPVLERHPEIHAVEWVPHVTPVTRASYEEAPVHDGIRGFRIVERDTQGDLALAGARDDYYPVYFVEPCERNRAVNAELCRDNDACVFVTAFFAVLDVATGEVSYANAGHNPPVHLRADGRIESLTGPGGVLGIMEGATYHTQSVTLTPGDCLILYTDGVTEALNRRRELFTEERLKAEAAGVLGKPAADVVTTLVRCVQTFADGTPQTDDIIVLALRYL